MKKFVFLISFLFPVLAIGQQSEFIISQLSSKQVNADIFVGEDSFDYQYFIKDNIFLKMKEDELFEYKNISLGKIARIDIQNPLKIILFYENFNTAIILDNQLNEIQKINFSETTETLIVSAIGIASRNSLWLFNSSNQQIGLYDYLKNNYKSVATPIAGTIKYYQTNFNAFYWIDERNYCYSCDIFGKIIALGKVPDFDAVQFISNTTMLYKKKDSLYYYTLNSDKPILVDLKKKSYESFYYKEQKLAIFTPEEITNYKINLP